MVGHQLDMSQPDHCVMKTASTDWNVKSHDSQSVWINLLHSFRELRFREELGLLV